MERYYTIQDQGEYDFRVGSTAEGRLVLLDVFHPGMLIIAFDAEGRFLSDQTRPWDLPDRRADGCRYEIHERPYLDAIRRQFQAWQLEVGFEPGTISIRKFFLEDRHLGIKDLPPYFEQYLADPAGFLADVEDPDDYPGLIHRWEDAGQFVLWWGKDYWMNADGDIEST